MFKKMSLVRRLFLMYLGLEQKIQENWTIGLHGSQNSYSNPKRPVNMLHGTDPDPYFITRADPRNALNVLPGPDTDPTIIRKLDPNPAGKTQTRLHPKK